MSNDYSVSTGSLRSFTDFRMAISIVDGETLVDIEVEEFTAERKREVGQKLAPDGTVLGTTTGKKTVSVKSFILTVAAHEQLNAALAKVAIAKGWVVGKVAQVGMVPFTGSTNYKLPDGTVAGKFKFTGMRLLGDTVGSKRGFEPETVTCTTRVSRIVQVLPDGTEVEI